jgi:hypothetical protein
MSQQFNVSPDNFRMPWIISQALKGVAKRAARLKTPGTGSMSTSIEMNEMVRRRVGFGSGSIHIRSIITCKSHLLASISARPPFTWLH